MQVGSSVSNRYYTPYQTNTSVKYCAGFSQTKDGKMKPNETTENPGFAEFVDYQEFHKAWMSQNGGNKVDYHFGTSYRVPKTEDDAGISEEAVSIAESEDEGEFLGLTMVPEEGQSVTYGMRAMLSEKSTPDNPIVQVVSNLCGKKVIYNVEVNKVNQNNATQLEVYGRNASTLLTTESTSCVYETADPDDDDIRYITWYTEKGIFCRKAGQTEGYEWSIAFENKEQYDKVMEFMGGTNRGVPDYSITIGDSMYIDKDKMQWAKYTNPLGTRFYTAEEMHQMQMEIIAANEEKLKEQQVSYEEMYKRTHPDYIAYAQEVMEDYKTLGNWDSYLAIDKWIQSLLKS